MVSLHGTSNGVTTAVKRKAAIMITSQRAMYLELGSSSRAH
jgi:hypothetical protein